MPGYIPICVGNISHCLHWFGNRERLGISMGMIGSGQGYHYIYQLGAQRLLHVSWMSRVY